MSATLAARQARRDQLAFWCWLIPALAVLLPLFVAPIARLARNSLNFDDPAGVMKPAFIADNYVKALTDPYFAAVFGNTLLVGAGVGLLCVAVAYPFAHFAVRWAGRSRTLLMWCVYVPLFVSVIMRVFGWMVIVADSGMVNRALLALDLVDEPLHMMFAVPGMVIGIVHRYLPLAILPIVNAMTRTDPAVLAASSNLGAGGLGTFFRVVVPLSLPGALAGFQLVLAGVMSDFVLPVLMGTTRFRMLAPVLYEEALTNVSWALAAALAMVMLAITAVVLLVSNLLVRRFAPWARA
jgi:putative spermidine/putrescine transport system permease protein